MLTPIENPKSKIESRTSRGFRIALAIVVLLAAAAGVAVYLLRQPAAGGGTYIPKKEVVTPEIRLLQQYVRVDTSNPPGNETAGARFLVEHLARNGVAAEQIEPAPGRGSVYARILGKRPGEGLLLLHHIDVWPAPPKGWRSPPFAAEIDLNMVWGRGALDAKGIGICHLEAFLAVARSGRQPERDLVFLATADEERGGHLGVEWLLRHRPDVFDGIRYALNEGGVTEMQAETVTYFGIEIGSKQFVKVDVRAADRAALERLRIALEPRFTPVDPDRILPEVKAFFAAIAPKRREFQHLLSDIDATVRDEKFWALHPTYRALTQNNLVAFGIRRDRDVWAMQVVLQNLPDEDPHARIRWLAEEARPFGAEVVTRQLMGPTRLSSPDTPMFALLQRSVREEYGPIDVGPMILGAATTDSRYLRARGIETYGLWPFPVDFHQTQGIHAVDERVRLDWFNRGVELTRRLVSAYVAE